MNIIEKSTEIDGQKLTLQFGKLAQAVDSSVYATLGDTAVLVTVAVGPENPNIDYFPLSIDGVNDPEVLSAIAVSVALSVSSIPWAGPISTVRVGYVSSAEKKESAFILYPTENEKEFSVGYNIQAQRQGL